MELSTLADQLDDPDPRRRVEALRILAMVEETRALEAIRWIYYNDPEPGVREVALWAGSLIWQAQQRGHSTLRAVEEMFSRKTSGERQEQFLASLEIELASPKNLTARRFAAERIYEQRLENALRGEEEPPALPARAPDTPPTAPPLICDDLLDAGLTELWSE